MCGAELAAFPTRCPVLRPRQPPQCAALSYAIKLLSYAMCSTELGFAMTGTELCLPTQCPCNFVPGMRFLIFGFALCQGIARALIAQCERIAAEEWGFREMFLHVKANNRPARLLYGSMGFVCEFQVCTARAYPYTVSGTSALGA
eukprot:1500487-Rhodomonas_salina.3